MMNDDLIKCEKTYMISIVGAGGKTTLANSLADFFMSENKKILVTTTTKMYVPKTGNVYIGDYKNIMSKNGVITAGSSIDEEQKIIGYDGQEIEELCDKKIFDYIMVEADGAKHKSLKAPNSYEPVIPHKSDLVIGIIGLDIIGKEINEDNIHRADIFAELTESSIGDIVDYDKIVKLVKNKNGLFKNCECTVGKILFFNKSDMLSRRDKTKLQRLVNNNVFGYTTIVTRLRLEN